MRIVIGDLLTQDVACIVNPWNVNIIPRWLFLPAGVSGQLKKKAGAEPFRELARFGWLSPGCAVLTGADGLKSLLYMWPDLTFSGAVLSPLFSAVPDPR